MDAFLNIKNSSHLDSLIPEFNTDLDGGIRLGNLYGFIGKEGTKKSLYAHNIGLSNAMAGKHILYLNMEMSVEEFVRRTVLMMFNVNLRQEVKDNALTEEAMRQYIHMAEDQLGGNLLLFNKNNIGPEDIVSIIERHEEKIGAGIDMVVIDSMNSLKLINSSEAITALQHMTQLKEVAKLKNTAIIFLNHVTKDCPFHFRESYLYARGGQKIADASDAFFCFSKCVDREASILEGGSKDIKYLRDKIWVRFVNKRETGNVVDKVLQLNDNITMSPVDQQASEYNVSIRSN